MFALKHKLPLLLLALLWPTYAVAHGRELQLDSICGTPEPSEQDVWAFAKIVRTHAAKIKADPNRRELAQSFSAVVPTVYHVIMNSTNAGEVQDRIIELQHTAMNAGFAGTGFSFEHVATIRTVNDTWYDVFPFTPEEQEMKMALHQGGFETLNVYIRGLPFGLLGYASLITVSPEIFTEPSLDGIVLSTEALPENGVYAEFGYDQGDSLIHETGHWLNLYHTFQGGCNNAWGDFVDDTPVMDGGGGCPAVAPDSCPDSEGVDPFHNFMSYFNDQCLDEFTPDQIFRMQAAWDYFRRGAGLSPLCTRQCLLKVPSVYSNLGSCRKVECSFENGNGNQVHGDSCSKAVKIKPGQTKSGSTTFATIDATPVCRGISPLAPGVWFRVLGTGGLLRASTCSFTSPFFDTQISVYKDGCSTLTCVAANDDSENCTDGRSEAFFLTEAGKEYLILVHGFNFLGAGGFDLSVSSVGKGNCFLPTFLPGCAIDTCQNTVCGINPFCCDVGWNNECALDACSLCTIDNTSPPPFCVCQDVRKDLGISITTDFFPPETTWKLRSISNGVLLDKGGPFPQGLVFPPPPTTYESTVVGLCSSDCFEFTIYDAYGDGICCLYGEGSYTLTFGDAIITTGGEFALSETVRFGNCLA